MAKVSKVFVALLAVLMMKECLVCADSSSSISSSNDSSQSSDSSDSSGAPDEECGSGFVQCLLSSGEIGCFGLVCSNSTSQCDVNGDTFEICQSIDSCPFTLSVEVTENGVVVNCINPAGGGECTAHCLGGPCVGERNKCGFAEGIPSCLQPCIDLPDCVNCGF